MLINTSIMHPYCTQVAMCNKNITGCPWTDTRFTLASTASVTLGNGWSLEHTHTHTHTHINKRKNTHQCIKQHTLYDSSKVKHQKDNNPGGWTYGHPDRWIRIIKLIHMCSWANITRRTWTEHGKGSTFWGYSTLCIFARMSLSALVTCLCKCKSSVIFSTNKQKAIQGPVCSLFLFSHKCMQIDILTSQSVHQWQKSIPVQTITFAVH